MKTISNYSRIFPPGSVSKVGHTLVVFAFPFNRLKILLVSFVYTSLEGSMRVKRRLEGNNKKNTIFHQLFFSN